MSFPTHIIVGPHKVPIFIKPKLEGDCPEEIVDGYFYPSDFHIEIRQSLRPARMAEVMLHEALHAVYSGTQFCSPDDEERAVTILASSLTKLAQDNPDFIRAWLSYATHQ